MEMLVSRVFLVILTLVSLTNCDVTKKAEKAEKGSPVEKKSLILKGKVVTYDRTELEKLLDEYFVTKESVRKSEAERMRAEIDYKIASKRTLVKNMEDYLQQVDLEQKAYDRLGQIPRPSVVTITENIMSYLPEKHVWYEATHAGEVYLIGVADTFFREYKGDGIRKIYCVDKIRDRLVVVRSKDAPQNPLDFVESHCEK